ncbi:cytochrome c oxidase assembly factor 6 homolog [Agrilus planipennis]|uniref:Cytochrome c oxidase assembly factor 6 homolog n=1 Tax=Agrilus planipennis TaxID=224129 RepID=A0A1W4WIL6_AGRPL|nr:cytochrome c oxidase assembly factor 6 homolog [Agrilus planipennis]XP_025836044.1 cytochrome c oxidase assembly factor 6 homolog [Agrilus planipennis]
MTNFNSAYISSVLATDMSFPTKEERSQCWSARDRYWLCLDEYKIDNPAKDGPCTEFRKIYENSCSAQWVKHFDRRRNYLKFKDKIEKEGYEPLDQRANVK